MEWPCSPSPVDGPATGAPSVSVRSVGGTGNSRDKRAEWRTEWTVVLACSAGFSLQSVSTYALGLFIDPLSSEFGWGRAQITAVSLIPAMFMILFSPPIGIIIDRRGSRLLALISIALTGAAIAAVSTATGSYAQWIGFWVFYGIVSLGTKITVWTSVISTKFVAARGMALGLTLCGAGISQIVVPPLAQWLIDDLGWRQAYFWLGIGWASPTFVLAFLFLHDRSTSPRSAMCDETAEKATAFPEGAGLTIREAARNVPLLRIGLSTLLTMFIGTAILIHQVPILTEAGIARSSAAWLASLAGFATVVGKLATGWMTDRFDASLVGAITMLAPSGAYLVLLAPGDSWVLTIIAMAVIGYTTGAKMQVASYLTAAHAGRRNFGKIFGVLTSIIGIGGGLGSVAAGWVFDRTGNYGLILQGGVVLSFVCAGLLFRLSSGREFE